MDKIKANMNNEEWEKELLEETKKSWGFIATESKQALMLADFEKRKSFIRTVREEAYQRGLENGAKAVVVSIQQDKVDESYQAGKEAMKKAAIEAVPKEKEHPKTPIEWDANINIIPEDSQERDTALELYSAHIGFNQCRKEILTALQSLPITNKK